MTGQDPGAATDPVRVRAVPRLVGGAARAARAVRGWVGRSVLTTRGRVLLAAVVVVALALPSGLGLLLASALGGDGGGPGEDRVATIGVLAPLSGASADAGVSVRNAVTLAVEEANRQGMIPGWKLQVVAHDDLSRPDGGAAGADLFADDDRMIGVVGPLSSSVAMVSLGRLSEAGLPVVSPSNAEPTLTSAPASPDVRPFPTYFRLSGTDAQLAEVAADYALDTLGRSRISVIDGGPDYGTITLAERFARDVRDAGATVPTVHRVDGGAIDDEQIEKTARAVRDEAPDLVYLATGADVAGELRQALADEGVTVQVLGADGLLDHDYVDRAGTLAEGDLVTDLSVPLSRLPSAGAFVTAYAKRFGELETVASLLPEGRTDEPAAESSGADTSAARSGSPDTTRPDGGAAARPGNPGDGGDGGDRAAGTSGATGAGVDEEDARKRELERARSAELAALWADAIPPVAASAHDAARALIRAASATLPGRSVVDADLRAAMVRAVGAGEFVGVTGQVAFDPKGDLRGPRVALYSVLSGRFVPLRVESTR
ncbi:branched-chain amino acid ABC transporter substrate-binding protein [Frankia sp. Cpl3]|uniref:branched-chain amino acid ABC transporter substrate-binding protein n=1 Tax=Parafrankia colletiae TaxID=573497 RepID=UPI000A050E07|nr:branched-chain amino acid ABC transporter substrate-binding protein [Parafrankia colletiae]MCK9899778.1 branched-chain amino acid ABC transporter substrate-binding protein [Frankia sp. Cpl3]